MKYRKMADIPSKADPDQQLAAIFKQSVATQPG